MIETLSRNAGVVSRRAASIAAAVATCLLVTGPSVARELPGPRSVAPVAEKLISAVVNISTSQRVKGPSGVPLPNVPKGSPFEDLFEDFFNRKGGEGPSSKKVASLGSGFVIDGKEGLIVTNNHVIDGADEITVNFSDGTALKVEKVLGKDVKTDLALLKVAPKTPLPEVKFGSSQNLRVGDWVMAIGNPFGLGGSVTVGIISAKQRDIQTGPYDDYLQTDAAINKGNSGGPLFNMDGDVIGVNTAIISPTGGSIGIGFAVPSDAATQVLGQLKKWGETRRGWLGVHIQSVTEDIATSLGATANVGALIAKVTPGGPAEKAGLLAGDVVLTFDGRPIAKSRTLPRIVAQTEEGRTVDVEVLRKGGRSVVKVLVGRLNEDATPKDKPGDETSDDGAKGLGLALAAIDDAARSRHSLGAKVEGVVITAVEKDSPAARRDLKVGEVIVEAGSAKVKTVADVDSAIAKARAANRRSVLLRVDDAKGNLRFVALQLR